MGEGWAQNESFMVLACVLLIVCGLLMYLSLIVGYRLCEKKFRSVCPLFRRFYCSGRNVRLKEEYLNRLDMLFSYDSELVANAIRNYRDGLKNRIEGWASDDSLLCADDPVDMGMLCNYLSLLEVCAQFQIHGIITYSMFWENYECRLRDILFCKELYLHIADEPALCGLKAALVEAGKRDREERAEELLPD